MDLQETLELHYKVLSVFGFTSAKFDLNLSKSYFSPILKIQRYVEPTVIRKVD